MNKSWILLGALASLLFCGDLKAGYIYFGPSVTFTAQQPVRAVFVDASGNTVERTCCYNSDAGGIDIGDASYTSVYFPDTNVRYIYNGGYWIDENGYYWHGGRRYFYDYPGWHDHWSGYWGGWHGGWHDGWHGGGWHGGGWHGGGWHGGGYHGGGHWHR